MFAEFFLKTVIFRLKLWFFTFTLILISLAAVIFLWKGKLKTCILSIACCAVLFFIPLTHSKIPAIKWAFPSAEIADFLEATNRQDNKLISIGYHEPSLVFLNGTDTYLASINDGVKKLKDEPKSLVLISHSKLEDFYLATTQAGLTTKLIETQRKKPSKCNPVLARYPVQQQLLHLCCKEAM